MIAIDAMGGDYAPEAIVHGALLAAKRGVMLCLYGDREKIEICLERLDTQWRLYPISIVHCFDTISMHDEPVSSFLKKKDTSLMQGLADVALGKADAFLSAGNTGACLVGGIMVVGKAPGIMRPAIGEFIPTLKGQVFCIDLGANVDCKPEHLEQFAFMGCAYVQLKKQIEKPRVVLLANGIEDSKGNKTTVATHELLKKSGLNFIGNREPLDILQGDADVMVSDGFTGNIMLKSLESIIHLAPRVIEKECSKSFIGRWGWFLGSRIFQKMRRRVSRVQKGGALLLGVNKPIIIAHGASQPAAIEDAIMYADSVVRTQFLERFNRVINQSIAHPAGHAGSNAAVSEQLQS
jgi:glycerol-3-phosphate acyltransferase PlsX